MISEYSSSIEDISSLDPKSTRDCSQCKSDNSQYLPCCADNSRNNRRRRNSKQRKEKTKDATRVRRVQESKLFQDLEDLLPMPGVPGTAQTALDKTTLSRLTLSDLKCREIVKKEFVLPFVKEESQAVMSNIEMLGSMDSFCLILSEEMDIIYISNNVENHIGLAWMELMGQSFHDYVHPSDYHYLKSVFNLEGGKRTEVYIRIKVTVTDRGQMINLRQANYKVLKISGKIRRCKFVSDGGMSQKIFLGLANLIDCNTMAQNPGNFPLSAVFHTKHSADMKFVETDQWLSSVGQYPLHYLRGMSFYEFIHAEDFQKVQNALQKLCEHGQCETPAYRFLVSGGGWMWIQTRANQSCARNGSAKGVKGHTISCTHTAISEVMNKGNIVALVQIITESTDTKKITRKQIIEGDNVKKFEPIARAGLIPGVKSSGDICNVSQILEEQSRFLPKEEEDICLPSLPKYIDFINLCPTLPSPRKSEPKCSTETVVGRPSVIVTAKPKEPRAVTTILFAKVNESVEKCPIKLPTMANVNQNTPEKMDMDIDNEAMSILSDMELDEIIPLEPLLDLFAFNA